MLCRLSIDNQPVEITPEFVIRFYVDENRPTCRAIVHGATGSFVPARSGGRQWEYNLKSGAAWAPGPISGLGRQGAVHAQALQALVNKIVQLLAQTNDGGRIAACLLGRL